jgi:predicted DsbA family dithiol-disulfide isomerase
VPPAPLGRPRARRAATLVVGACLVAGCAARGPQATAPSPPPSSEAAAPAPDTEPVWLEVAGRSYTSRDVDAWIRDECFEREVTSKPPHEQYEARADAIEHMADDLALKAAAARRGVSPEELLESEVAARGPVTAGEIAAFYEANRDRMGDVPLEDVAEDIARYLERQRPREVRAALREDARVRVLLEPPRILLDPVGPSRGPADAPVTVIEFGDYQCPFCRRAEPTVRALMERYPRDLRYVYRQLPLDSIHPGSRLAAQGAVCADSAGRFWEFHEELFANPKALARADLVRYARAVGLEPHSFEACLDHPGTRARVDQDVDAARAAGIRGTPTFVVNGILLSGVQPLDRFVRLIEQELERSRRGAKPAS